MGIRIEQINLDSFSKIFPLRVDIEDMLEDFEQGIISGEIGPTIVGDKKAIDIEKNEAEIVVKAKTASANNLGVVKIGQNINVTEDGVISTDVNKAYVDEKLSGIDGSVGDVVENIEIKFEEKLEQIKQECTQNIENIKEQVTQMQQNYDKKLEELDQRVTSNYEEIQDLKDQIKEILENQASLTELVISLNKRVEELEQTVGEEMLDVKKFKNFTYGEFIIVGYDAVSKIMLPDKMYTNGDYTVHLTPSSSSEGDLGEYWIVDKQPEFFKVKNTGGKRTTKCCFITHGKELSDPQFDASSYPYQSGSNTFAGQTGKQVTLTNSLKNTNYSVIITPSGETNGDLGEFWVSEKTNNTFKVFNSGGEVDAPFDYLVVAHGQPDYSKGENRLMEGKGNFPGNGEATTVSLEGNIDNLSYSVLITPTNNPGGDLGEYWVEQRTSNSFIVKNTGSSTVSFDYVIIG